MRKVDSKTFFSIAGPSHFEFQIKTLLNFKAKLPDLFYAMPMVKEKWTKVRRKEVERKYEISKNYGVREEALTFFIKKKTN